MLNIIIIVIISLTRATLRTIRRHFLIAKDLKRKTKVNPYYTESTI